MRAICTLHTLVWAVFTASIVAIPVYASLENLRVMWGLSGFVFIEVIILLANRMRCPLTDVAGRYTAERRENFDIPLPLWLARHNKTIFGGLYVAGLACTAWVAADASAWPCAAGATAGHSRREKSVAAARRCLSIRGERPCPTPTKSSGPSCIRN